MHCWAVKNIPTTVDLPAASVEQHAHIRNACSVCSVQCLQLRHTSFFALAGACHSQEIEEKKPHQLRRRPVTPTAVLPDNMELDDVIDAESQLRLEDTDPEDKEEEDDAAEEDGPVLQVGRMGCAQCGPAATAWLCHMGADVQSAFGLSRPHSCERDPVLGSLLPLQVRGTVLH